MARIFLSHSSANNAHVIALRDWMVADGWDDLFLDFDPTRGIAAGERWERALNEAAHRCEAVVFLISKAWLASTWCVNELTLARRLNKRLFGVLIEEDLSVSEVPSDLTSTWQLVNLATGRDRQQFRVTLPVTGEEVDVSLSVEGLGRLKSGLWRAGLHASHFKWPPEHDPERPPFRGLKPLEADDAGIFFGRGAHVIEAIDRLRGLREAAPPRLLVILGASGAGKSSFLRAGLLPRLARDDATFLPLPIIRPEHAPITGESGLLGSLANTFEQLRLEMPRAELLAAIDGGAAKLKPLLQTLVEKSMRGAADGDANPKRPAIVLAIDQGEELFLAEAQREAQAFLSLLRDLQAGDDPVVMAVFTIRSDNYERMQEAEELEGVHQETLSLPPMPKGSYAEIIRGPVGRLDATTRKIKVDEALVQALLSDVEQGSAKDALALLAFTLERLYDEYHSTGHLELEHYKRLGGVKGSIEAAVERAFEAADADARIPLDRPARLGLLRKALIPWLAGIDPDSGAPRRRVARLSEIPPEARPLIDQLVAQRLLSTDVAKDTGENTIEPTHEALLRQWSLLQGWLAEDAGLLGVMETVKRASRDWAANGKHATWLTHGGYRLTTAEGLRTRPDLSGNLDVNDWDYLAACRKAQRAARRRRRRAQALVTTLLLAIIAGLLIFINRAFLDEQFNWYSTMRPYMIANFRPHVLAAEAERALKPGQVFRECAQDCPEMIVVPAGSFVMGSPPTEKDRYGNEGPQQSITIARPFAVSKFHVTFAQWDACVAVGGCPQVADSGFGRGSRPVINMTWPEAKGYVAWLSRMTGKPYRLLSEAEWEFAARAGTQTPYTWGEDVGNGKANCNGCGSQWDNRQTSPVGSFKPNAFGLFDVHGNVFQWLEDCYEDSLEGLPPDGSPRTGNCSRHVRRGGSWTSTPKDLRAAGRSIIGIGYRNYNGGLRVGRTLSP